MENDMLRTIYDTLLDSGDLHDLMPEATGIWEEDKKKFKHIQENLDSSVSDFENFNFQKMIDEDDWDTDDTDW